jgi:hypothetical protein
VWPVPAHARHYLIVEVGVVSTIPAAPTLTQGAGRSHHPGGEACWPRRVSDGDVFQFAGPAQSIDEMFAEAALAVGCYRHKGPGIARHHDGLAIGDNARIQ